MSNGNLADEAFDDDFKLKFSPYFFRILIPNDLPKLVSKHPVRRHIYDMCTINLEIHRLRVDRTAYIERSVAPNSLIKDRRDTSM